jgi:hypothetical protein
LGDQWKLISRRKQEVPKINFEECRQQMIFSTIYSKSEIYLMMKEFREECIKLVQVNPFMMHFSKAVRLEEFEQLQLQSLSNFKNRLHEK